MPHIGPFELLIILVIILLVFGASRVTSVAGALGSSLREFKKAARDEDLSDVKKIDHSDRQL